MGQEVIVGSYKKIYPFHTPFIFLILKEDGLMAKKILRFIYISPLTEC